MNTEPETSNQSDKHESKADLPPDSVRDQPTPEPRRRPRYRGTHPRRFEERYKELNPAAYPDIQSHVLEQGRTPAGTHVPVMLTEVMAALLPKHGDVVADCTVGYGGHAQAFMEKIGPQGRLIGLDVDEVQLERARSRLSTCGVPFQLHRSNFAGLGAVLAREGLEGFDIIFADLGLSSMQIDDPERGFSYKHDGPLDMRMSSRLIYSARDLLAGLSAGDLATAISELADEPDAALIAEAIVEQRGRRELETTHDLVALIFNAKRISRREWQHHADGELHPAARTFQALRIMVNDELDVLRQFLRTAPYCMRPGGRLGIISFHSGEDRIVADAVREGLAAERYSNVCYQPEHPTAAERRFNPRSASAVFRWAIRSATL